MRACRHVGPAVRSYTSTYTEHVIPVGPAVRFCKYSMRAYITKPVPIHMQKTFERYAKTNAYRFVFFCYGTNDHGDPHYALYTWERVNPLALLYISEYILEEIRVPPYTVGS